MTPAVAAIAPNGRTVMAFAPSTIHPAEYGEFEPPAVEAMTLMELDEEGEMRRLTRLGVGVEGIFSRLETLGIRRDGEEFAVLVSSTLPSLDLGGGEIAGAAVLAGYRLGSSLDYAFGRALGVGGYGAHPPYFLDDGGLAALVYMSGPISPEEDGIELPDTTIPRLVLVSLGFD